MASSYVALPQASSFDNVTAAVMDGHQQCTGNGRLITSNTGYWEVLWGFKNINKLLWLHTLSFPGRSRDQIPVGRDFPPFQSGPEAHPASSTMGTGSFPGLKSGQGVLLITHPLLVPWSWKSRAIPLPTLWATTGPVTGTLYLVPICELFTMVQLILLSLV